MQIKVLTISSTLYKDRMWTGAGCPDFSGVSFKRDSQMRDPTAPHTRTAAVFFQPVYPSPSQEFWTTRHRLTFHGGGRISPTQGGDLGISDDRSCLSPMPCLRWVPFCAGGKDPLFSSFQQGQWVWLSKGVRCRQEEGIVGLSSPGQPREQVQASRSVIKSDAQKKKKWCSEEQKRNRHFGRQSLVSFYNTHCAIWQLDSLEFTQQVENMSIKNMHMNVYSSFTDNCQSALQSVNG